MTLGPVRSFELAVNPRARMITDSIVELLHRKAE